MQRVYNFSSGPAVLPLPVLKKAAAQMTNYENTGMSVMEMSHRSKMYEDIINRAECLLRELLSIPVNYRVMFLQGGASTQFAMIPLNLFSDAKKADYVNTGMWSKRAIAECKKFGTVNVAASSEDSNFNRIPEFNTEKFDQNADFCHITYNNTVYGTKFSKLPDTNGVPLVADMSSYILSEPVDVSKFGLIYAGAQKNMGPAGVTVVIVRDDLIEKRSGSNTEIPTMLDYKIHAETASMYNTPPTYGIYVVMLVLEWIKDLGGISQMAKTNLEKAQLLYDYLDNSEIFKPTVCNPHRSLMNVPFVLPTDEQNEEFIKSADANGFLNLKGYRTIGGMRASIYNAMPVEGVAALVDFMKKFEQKEVSNV